MIGILVNSLAGGGAERIALNLFNEFREKGLDVIFLCIEKEQVYAPPEGAPVIYLTNFQKLRNPIFKMIWVFISAYRLSRYIRQYNIAHIQSHLFRANFINTSAKLFGARHYAQIISHWPLNFKKDIYPLRKLKQFVYRWFYKRANEAVSISKMMKKSIEDTLDLESNGLVHRVVPNPHDLPAITELANQRPFAFNFLPEKAYLISAGRLEKHKKVDVIIQAFAMVSKKVKNVELLILGDGAAREDLEKLAVALQVTKQVHFLGHLPNPFAYIKQADIFVMASEKEGLPNIIIESMICGTPVISSDCISGPREILSPDSDFQLQLHDKIEFATYGVLCPVGKEELLAESILHLLNDEQLRKTYIKKGKYYIHKFDKSTIASQLINSFPQKKNEAVASEII